MSNNIAAFSRKFQISSFFVFAVCLFILITLTSATTPTSNQNMPLFLYKLKVMS